jgi:predicted GTPase
VRPVTYGKYTLSPVVIDTAGLEPHHSIDEFRAARFRFRWKRKLVLVVVLAPRPENTRASVDAEFDHDYLEEQKGYVTLVDGLTGGRRRRSSPDAVVVFVTKFDLLSQQPPNDSSSDAQRGQIDALFAEHRSRIEKFCKKPNVPVHWIVGSAKRGWGITELRDSIQQIVS